MILYVYDYNEKKHKKIENERSVIEVNHKRHNIRNNQ